MRTVGMATKNYYTRSTGSPALGVFDTLLYFNINKTNIHVWKYIYLCLAVYSIYSQITRIEQSCFACNDRHFCYINTQSGGSSFNQMLYIFCLHKMCVKLSVEILNVVFGLLLFKKYKLTTNWRRHYTRTTLFATTRRPNVPS